MRVLVTAGNTLTPVDRVRALTNVFSGRTGASIAGEARRRGHEVLLLTSKPETADGVPVREYRTFDDLADAMAELVPGGGWDVIVHAAAVSDYQVAGIFAPGCDGLRDVSAGKVKSSHAELWLKLTPTPKLVDRIREPWGFGGTLVKFKLEVGLSEDELLAVAERARLASGADLMVANTLETMHDCAYLGPVEGRYGRVPRAGLAKRLMDAVEERCAPTP
jgi:phosphopantothenate-cysteine ligase/phosphopantothenoylcysteine decarboxylase/phosphopantothenate--cysteine ligase